MRNTKATSKSASEAYGIDFLQCNSQDFTTQIFNSCFHFFPFYSHTRELGFDCFQSQIFNFYLILLFFKFYFCVSSHHYVPIPKIPDKH